MSTQSKRPWKLQMRYKYKRGGVSPWWTLSSFATQAAAQRAAIAEAIAEQNTGREYRAVHKDEAKRT